MINTVKYMLQCCSEVLTSWLEVPAALCGPTPHHPPNHHLLPLVPHRSAQRLVVLRHTRNIQHQIIDTTATLISLMPSWCYPPRLSIDVRLGCLGDLDDTGVGGGRPGLFHRLARLVLAPHLSQTLLPRHPALQQSVVAQISHCIAQTRPKILFRIF